MNVSIFFQEVKWQKKIKVKPQKINVTALYNGVKYCLYQFNNRRARVKQLQNGRHVLSTQLSF